MSAGKIAIRSRTATWGDLHRLAEIYVAAFDGVETQDFFYPYRHDYPQDWFEDHKRGSRNFMLMPNVVVSVAVAIVAPQDSETVIAYSVWMFDPFGPQDPQKRSRPRGINLEKNSLGERFWRGVLPVTDRINRYFHPNRAANPAAGPAFVAAQKQEIKECWSGDYALHWHLGVIATDPNWQRHGAGSLLLEFGEARAREDEVVTGLESVKGAIEFYRKKGYEEIGEIACQRPEYVWPVMIHEVAMGEKAQGC